jgi:hypothetical protein
MNDTLASTRSETVEPIVDTSIERSQATTDEMIMSQFERLNVNLGHTHGQPLPPSPAATAYGGTHSRINLCATIPTYAPDPYMFDGGQSRRIQFDDGNFCRSLGARGATFTADNNFP